MDDEYEPTLEYNYEVWWHNYLTYGTFTMKDDGMWMTQLEIMELPETVMCNH